MKLRRLLAAWPLLERQSRIIHDQKRLIDEQADEIRRAHLEHAREMRGLVCAWLIHSERPEVDLRTELAGFDRELSNRIAQLEEHILE